MAGRMTDNFETLADILKDKDIDMGRAALSLAALFHPDIKSGRYQNHLDKLVVETGYRHKELLDAGADDSIETRLAALKHIIADKHGYEGDLNDPGHIRNADLISVIDRGKGSPVGLCVIYIYVAMAQGWDVHGIDLPGYFAVRLDKKGERLLFDPCAQCRILGAPELRQIV